MIGWITDPHLNFLRSADDFGIRLRQEFPEVDLWLITGDIAESYDVFSYLVDLRTVLGKDILFILGNHDYYHASFDEVDEEAGQLGSHTGVTWLRKAGVVAIGNTAIVGNCGWYDARYGNSRSRVHLNDFRFIVELTPGQFNRDLLVQLCDNRAKRLANELKNQMREAVKQSDNIIVATHVPPYAEACWHKGEVSDAEWLPWFTSYATGQAIDEVAEENTDKKFVVLCGHSHGSGIYERGNITVYTGASEYLDPGVSGLIDTNALTIDLQDKRLYFGKY
jgi:predicted phosphohydrolase